MQAELSIQITALVGSQFADSISNILSNYDITRKTAPIPPTNPQLLNLFLSAKTIEGKSPKTLMYYKNTLTRLLTTTKKAIEQTTTNDLRNYLSDFQNTHGVSNVTIDNIRRILSSFFSWPEDEDFIIKSPMRRIHKVKTIKIVKKIYLMKILKRFARRLHLIGIVPLLSFWHQLGFVLEKLLTLISTRLA